MPQRTHHIRDEDWPKYQKIAKRKLVPHMLSQAIQGYVIPPPVKKKKVKIHVPPPRLRNFQDEEASY